MSLSPSRSHCTAAPAMKDAALERVGGLVAQLPGHGGEQPRLRRHRRGRPRSSAGRRRCRRCTSPRRARSRPGRTAPPAGRPPCPTPGCRRAATSCRGSCRTPRRRRRCAAAPRAARRAAPAAPSSHASVSRSIRSVREALDTSVTCAAPARHLVDEPGVDGAEAQLARLGLRRGRPSRVEQPAQLGAGEVGVEHEAGGGLHPRLFAAGLELGAAVARCGGPARRWRWCSGLPVPRSHRPVVSRWLVMPMAATSVPLTPAALQRLARCTTRWWPRSRPGRARPSRASGSAG